MVAAGTNLSILTPTVGVLQNLRIQLGAAVPMYFDSKSTVYVISSDASVKKSAWLIRRVDVLAEAVAQGAVQPIHIPECDMAADPFTKYLTLHVWLRHMHFVLNKPGELPRRGG